MALAYMSMTFLASACRRVFHRLASVICRNGISVASSGSVGVGVFGRVSGLSFESEGRSVGRAVGRLVGLALLAGCAIIPRIHSCRTLTLYHQTTIHCEGWFFGACVFVSVWYNGLGLVIRLPYSLTALLRQGGFLRPSIFVL